MFRVTDDLCTNKGNRFINFMIDTVIFLILSICAFSFIVFILFLLGADVNVLILWLRDRGNGFLLNIFLGVSFSLFYFLSEVIFKGRTIGKYVTNTVVVDKNGNTPTFIAILKRSLIRFIPFYWISFWGLTPRGWHDLASGTYVVDKEKFEKIKVSKKIEE